MDMDDDDVIQEILASQDGTELAPTDEMMMMNSATANDIDFLDPEMAAMLQQSTIQINPPPPPPPSAATSTTTATTTITTRSKVNVNNDADDDDELIEDETLLERIAALKEMFPERLQNAVGTVNSTVINTTKLAFNKGRTAAWWITSTMCVLVFPILIQKELLQVAEQISREQRSILLGPQAATGAFTGGAF